MKYIVITFSIFTLLLSCSNNVLIEFGSKSSDAALLFDAQTAVNAQRYDDAITIITQKVSSSGRITSHAREILASGYAGKCGLNFLDYTTRLAAAVTGSTFVLVSAPFVGVVVDPASCLLSLQTLDLIGTNAQRTINQNAFAAIVGMVLMGTATRFYTDNIPVNGDGTQDAVDISCGLTDVQMDNIILGYAYMSQNFAALSTQIGASSSTTISASIATCTALAGAACSNTNPALITAPIRDTMRKLLNTVNYGVGTKDGSTPILIQAACP